jgi:hypothetical protein
MKPQVQPKERLTAKQMAESGIRKRIIGQQSRALASNYAKCGDPTGAHWQNREADILLQRSGELLDLPAEYVERGRGGEIVPVAPADLATPRGQYFKDTIKDSPDVATAAASYERMKLAEDADALVLGVDMAETIRAKNSAERAIAHQMGAAHGAAMRMFQAGSTFAKNATRYAGAGDQSRANVEAARCFNSATRLMEAFSQAGLAIKKLRSRNSQTVKVIHQHIDNRGGQAVVAGDSVKGRGKRRGRE